MAHGLWRCEDMLEGQQEALVLWTLMESKCSYLVEVQQRGQEPPYHMVWILAKSSSVVELVHSE